MFVSSPLLVCILAISLFYSAGALQCYECSSLLDDNCGVTWGLSVVDSEQYKVTCPDGTTACKKLISNVNGGHDKMVTRFCWNQTNTEGFTPTGCEKLHDGIENCYCSGNLCNGQSTLYAFTGVVVLGVIVALLKV